LEPLRVPASESRAIVGVFDLKPLAADFFASGLQQRYPVQLLDGDTILYRSHDWRPFDDSYPPVIVEHLFSVDAARWIIQMEPGTTGIVQALSSFNLLLITLSIVAGGGVIAVIWLLVMRTWLLQRAVTRRTAALRRTLERLRQLATTDELTGLHNRRFFLNRWRLEYHRAKRYRRPLACLMIDVNGFKQVNDRFGHHTGDLVLKRVAKELQAMLRETDLLARFGGDEFIIALPETMLDQAQLVAEKLRELRVMLPPQRQAPAGPPVRLSVGIGVLSGAVTPEQILQAADESLYASRRQAAQAAEEPIGLEAA
jgi:diguanylate cyclase (GGDEF)-like protein